MATINTTIGEMDESLLQKEEGIIDNDNEYTTWVQYWLDGKIVYRSLQTQFRKTVVFTDGVASFE